MLEAYEIGISLVLNDNMSAGLAAVRGELGALDQAIGASRLQLGSLTALASGISSVRIPPLQSDRIKVSGPTSGPTVANGSSGNIVDESSGKLFEAMLPASAPPTQRTTPMATAQVHATGERPDAQTVRVSDDPRERLSGIAVRAAAAPPTGAVAARHPEGDVERGVVYGQQAARTPNAPNRQSRVESSVLESEEPARHALDDEGAGAFAQPVAPRRDNPERSTASSEATQNRGMEKRGERLAYNQQTASPAEISLASFARPISVHTRQVDYAVGPLGAGSNVESEVPVGDSLVTTSSTRENLRKPVETGQLQQSGFSDSSAPGANRVPFGGQSWTDGREARDQGARDSGLARAATTFGDTAAAPTAHTQAATGPIEGDVYLDGTHVGRWVSRHLAQEVSRPQSGTSGFDPRQSPVWPGVAVGT